MVAGSRPGFAAGERDVPQWERVLNDVLTRAEAERSELRADESPEAKLSFSPAARAAKAKSPHPIVAGFVRYFSSAGAKHFQASQKRLESFRAMIEQVFEQEGLPRELLWVGLVESGYDPAARSPKNAVGIWQLIPETAETFGLRMSGRDERTDPLKSTRAAARYLKFLYARFGDWPLTLAAYNAGERRVQSAIVKGQTTDFWRLAESGLLPRETQAYVPAVMAAQYLGEGRLGELADAHDSTQRTTGKVVFATIGVSP